MHCYNFCILFVEFCFCFFLFFFKPIFTAWMFEHDCLDTCCFGCHICMCFRFCSCTCSVQLSMFHMERHSRNSVIVFTIVINRLTDMIPLISRLPSKEKEEQRKAYEFFTSTIRTVISDKRKKEEKGWCKNIDDTDDDNDDSSSIGSACSCLLS